MYAPFTIDCSNMHCCKNRSVSIIQFTTFKCIDGNSRLYMHYNSRHLLYVLLQIRNVPFHFLAILQSTTFHTHQDYWLFVCTIAIDNGHMLCCKSEIFRAAKVISTSSVIFIITITIPQGQHQLVFNLLKTPSIKLVVDRPTDR